MRIITNPDTEYVSKKKKAIKKNNNFCLDCPRTEDWVCKGGRYCKEFTERATSGWCKEAVYYKDFEHYEDGSGVGGVIPMKGGAQ